MAISRIGGKALRANLERDSNLTFNTDTLAIDYSNGRIGIGTATPSSKLNVIGDTAITVILRDVIKRASINEKREGNGLCNSRRTDFPRIEARIAIKGSRVKTLLIGIRRM